MNGLGFLEIINDIDNALVENAAKEKIRRDDNFVIKLLVIAAAICGAIVIIWICLENRNEIIKTVSLPEEIGNDTIIQNTDSVSDIPNELIIQNQSETTNTEPVNSADNESVIKDGPELLVVDSIVIIPGTDNVYDQNKDEYMDENQHQEVIFDDTYYSNPTEEIAPAEDLWENNEEPLTSEPPAVQPEYRVAGIIWGQEENEVAYPTFEENVLFWQDDTYRYYMETSILLSANVIYEDGSYESVIDALSNGHIEIDDLDIYGVPYYIE